MFFVVAATSRWSGLATLSAVVWQLLLAGEAADAIDREDLDKLEGAAGGEGYTTGVSLHSHTSCSEESLHFIHALGLAIPGVRALTRRYERLCRERHAIALDFDRANWRPPLQPRMAYEVEAG